MPAARTLAAISGLALLLIGCASDVPRKDFAPPAPAATSVEQLSGEYCYYGPDFNVRSYRRPAKAIPFLDVEALGQPTKVSVEATTERIVFTYTDVYGEETQQVFLPSRFRAVWREDALVIPWEGSRVNVGKSIVPGIVFGTIFGVWEFAGWERESRLFKVADGRLVLSDSFRIKGYSERHKQGGTFYEREDSIAVFLDPMMGDCTADASDRPLQPLYERGLDLRAPACMAQLERQLASILAEKGEAAEAAEALAHDRVTALSARGENWADFSVSSPSGVTYKFDFGKNKAGCVLRMYGRGKKGHHFSSSVESHIWFFAKRPLPDCACNP